MKPLRLAIDLDHVLHNPEDVAPGYKMGRPIPGAVEAMNKLKAEGAILVIHSVWADTEQKRRAMSDWLRWANIPYDFITNKKLDCDFFVDNKAIHHTTWDNTMREIRARTNTEPGNE